MPTPDRLASAADVAQAIGVKPSTVLTMARTGKLPAIRVGRKTIRFDLPAVLDFLKARSTPPAD